MSIFLMLCFSDMKTVIAFRKRAKQTNTLVPVSGFTKTLSTTLQSFFLSFIEISKKHFNRTKYNTNTSKEILNLSPRSKYHNTCTMILMEGQYTRNMMLFTEFYIEHKFVRNFVNNSIS